MIVAKNAFEQWVTRCGTASGVTGYSPLELLILHLIDYISRPKRMADICFALKIEDTHLVSYALKKLAKGGFVESFRQGKDTVFVNTPQGAILVSTYRDVRKQVLSRAFQSLTKGTVNLEEMADTMRAFASVYEQAARNVEFHDYESD
ncbi:MAG: winged helix DNA-binding protein [Phyllobacteriaceae bacterium]|nr:winged helix DNA-binding protein [Phyllobacteriaceae bacterium]